MSNAAASATVIQMRDFDRPVPSQNATQFERLLRECQDLALGRLEKSLDTMLDKADEALWQLASASQDRDTRDLFIKAKDKANAQRRVIAEQFRSHYLSEFQSRCARGKKPVDEFSKFDLSSLELDLVAEDDLDETLKTNEMAGKLRRYCEEELVALDQRVGVLIGDATLQGEANPFSPQVICTAYRQAIKHVESELKVRMVFHKLFDDHVLDDIRSIYKDLNALLVQRSILPKIRYGVQRAAGIAPRAAAGLVAAAAQAGGLTNAAAAAAGEAFIAQSDGTPGGAEQDFFAVLQGLMGLGAGMQRAAMGVGDAAGAPMVQVPGFPPILGGAPGGAVARLQGAELLGSLTRIQHGDVSSIGGGNLPLAAQLVEPGTTNVLRELKGTAFGSGLGQADAMTLDIVTMLFDQIFDDSKIPSAMKGLIGRLQIPMLKVAILDKEFFSKKSHPARKFLDALGAVAIELPADFGTSSPLFVRLEGIVQRLIDSFQDSIEVFDKLRGELEGVLEEENRRAEEEARVTAQKMEQKERLEVARAVAQHAIKLRAERREMPRAVLKFLSGQWVKLLLIAYAKHGPDSEAYKTALTTMDMLIWSVTPMQRLEDRRELAAKLPGLLKRINYGMQLVGTDEATRRTFFGKLMRCHTKVINGTAGTRAAAPAPAPTPAAAPVQVPAIPGDPPVLTDVAPEADAGARIAPLAEPLAAQQSPATASEADADTEPAAALPEFTAVTIRNPFGEGEIEIEEIEMSSIPGVAGELPAPPADAGGDEYGHLATSLREGAWIEFRDDDDMRRPARLSYISPLKGTYLFVNRQGRKVGEYSLYQLAREFRAGRAVVLDEVPLFDRAMTSLVGVLKKSGKVH